VLPYKRRKKPLEIEREGATRFQNRASKGRREEREEKDWRGDLPREQEGFVLKVVKLQIILGASNLLFHHSLVRSFYTRACSPKSCCCLR